MSFISADSGIEVAFQIDTESFHSAHETVTFGQTFAVHRLRIKMLIGTFHESGEVPEGRIIRERGMPGFIY